VAFVRCYSNDVETPKPAITTSQNNTKLTQFFGKIGLANDDEECSASGFKPGAMFKRKEELKTVERPK